MNYHQRNRNCAQNGRPTLTGRPLEIVNPANFPLRLNFDRSGLSKLVILPDYCPGRYFATGTVSVFDATGHNIHPEYLGEDIGCGMLCAGLRGQELHDIEDIIDSLATELIENRNGLGSLGGGNHFITLYRVSHQEKELLFGTRDSILVIHSGNRGAGARVLERKYDVQGYLDSQADIVECARVNRLRLLDKARLIFRAPFEVLFDRPHNSVQSRGGRIVYRKGAVALEPGQKTIITSSMAGDAVIVSAKKEIVELESSMSHGTGRIVPRDQAKLDNFFLEGLPQPVYTPRFISLEHLASEMPQCYRTIDEVLPYLDRYVKPIARLTPVASVML